MLIIGAGLCGLGEAISIAFGRPPSSSLLSLFLLHFLFFWKARLSSITLALVSKNPFRMASAYFDNGGTTEGLKCKAAVPETLSMIRYDKRKVLVYRSSYNKELGTRYEYKELNLVFALH